MDRNAPERGIDNGVRCKYLSDDFNEICVNAESPACADFCPCVNYPQICKYAENDPMVTYIFNSKNFVK